MRRPAPHCSSVPPGLVARLLVAVAALSLTSCPGQDEAVQRLWRAVIHRSPSKAKRTMRRLVADTANNAQHLTGPQIAAPPDTARDLSETIEPSAANAVAPRYAIGTAQLAPAADVPVQSHATGSEDTDGAAWTRAERTISAQGGDESTSIAPALTLPVNPSNSELRLYSIGRETQIYSEPSFDAKRIGYLRFGSDVRGTAPAVSRKGCAGGWYGVQPMGYVCANGRTATTDSTHPLLSGRLGRPDRMAPLPYAYTMARRGVPRLFAYAPSAGERPAKHFSKRLISTFAQWRHTPTPDWWRKPREVFGFQRPKQTALLGDGLPGAGVALLGFFVDEGTLYGITPELELVTTDALEPIRASSFAGKVLSVSDTLPVAFAMSSTVWLYRGDPDSGALQPARRLAQRESVVLSDERIQVQGQPWRRTKEGLLLRVAGTRIVERRTDWPEWAKRGSTWVDVSIEQQTLVAYEGTRPAYVTLVSTGVDGLQDPETTKSTKTGVFHIVSKHLTATMNSDEPEDAYEMREVPWVQYFSQGYALHAAYWHDAFGQPRSHGCVNLSPIDARWLFHFTNPGLPQNWHGAIPGEPSATVFVHP